MGKVKKDTTSNLVARESPKFLDIPNEDILYRFQYVTTALLHAATIQQVADIVVNLGLATLHASSGSVWLFDEQKKLAIAGYTGYTREQIEKREALLLQESSPLMDVIRFRKPIIIHSRIEREKIYPQGDDFLHKTDEGFITIPLVAKNDILGAVDFTFKEEYNFSTEEQEFIYALVQQCVGTLERIRLQKEEIMQKESLQKVIDRVNALQRVTTLLSKSLTAEEMGNIIIAEATKVLGAYGGEVSILSDDKKTLKMITFLGYPPSIKNNSSLLWKETSTNQPLLLVDVIKSRKLFIFENRSQLSHLSGEYVLMQTFLKLTGVQSGIIQPIVTESNLHGVFAIFFKEERHFFQEEIEFLFTLTQQFSQSYDRAKAYETEKQQREQLTLVLQRIELLQYITSLLSKAVTLHEVLQTIVKEGAKILNAKGGEVALLSEDRKKLYVAAYHGYPKGYVKQKINKNNGFTKKDPLIMWDVLKNNAPLFTSNIDKLPTRFQVARSFLKLSNFQSQATVPLVIGQEVVGCFQMLFSQKINFRDGDKEFILALAHQASQAIERSQIYERQKRITESLRQSRENWIQLIETVPQIVWSGDESGRTEYFSKRWEDYTGLSVEETIKKKLWITMIHPDDQERVTAAWNKNVAAKVAAQLEYRIRNKAGVYRWFLSKAVPIKDERGNVVRWLGADTDIHDQKIASQEIEKREARFRALIDNSSDAITLIDEKAKILYSSPSTKRVTGYSPEEKLGKSLYTSIYPKDKEKTKAFVDALTHAQHDNLLSITYRIINKDGSIPWIEGVGKNLLDNPNVGAIVINYRDITERVEAEEVVRQSKDELEIIFENTADAIIVWDKSGKILFCNKAAAELNRYSSVEEFLEDNRYNIFLTRFESFLDEEGHIIPEAKLTVTRALTEKRLVDEIMCVTFRHDHEQQWRRVKSAPVLDEQGNVQLIITVAQDISEEKQKERIKDDFISTASHELKTPITSAKLYTGIVSERIRQSEDEKAYAMITRLDVQLDRLTKLINDLLDITKIRSGKIVFSKEKVGIKSFIRDIVEEMQYTTVMHTLYLVGDSEKTLNIDKERMRQVFTNILSNAIKYSPDANRIDISIKDERKGVVICVEDYGVGIEKSEQEKIFQPFYRSNKVSAGKFSGLGLGLHISYEIVKRHGGNMWVESTGKGGTKMFVFLPLKQKGGE